MKLANKTIAAIDAALEEDRGAKFRGLLKAATLALTDAFDDRPDTGFRSHLGASIVGRPCAREIWYSWHWAKASAFDGRMLRLFNRGHLEEARFIAMLRLIGCQLWATGTDGKQLRIAGCNGHFGGSLDAVVLGLPENPAVPHLAEFKTHSNKSFSSLKGEGVKQAKWEHYVQMQLYMHAQGLTEALYLAVNKDTDELFGELVSYEKETAERYLTRAQAVIDSPEPPARISDKPSWYQCKFCSYSKMCHAFEEPAKNCRTCAHSTPDATGMWKCEYPPFREIPKNCEACTNYIVNPSMLNGIEVFSANMDQNWYRYRKADGTEVDTREK